MKIAPCAFSVIDWGGVNQDIHPGEAGVAIWRTRHVGDIRVRMVEYSPGYVADHWCEKGHILLCVAGRLDTELQDGRSFALTPGMSYEVGDDVMAHKSRSSEGATLFIVD